MMKRGTIGLKRLFLGGEPVYPDKERCGEENSSPVNETSRSEFTPSGSTSE
jgi:hypothetical protein